MNKILLNDYERLEHNRAISEDDYNVSYSCDFSVCDMFYTIHNSIEILFGDEGRATYYIGGKNYV